MRRVASLTAMLCILLAGCTQEARPEGVAESWLRSLNQGAAGRPDRYAVDAVSEQVVPGWRDLEPGQLDTIEVALTTRTDTAADVSFRVVDVDGKATAGTAHLQADGDSWTIAGVDVSTSDRVVTDTSARGGLPLGWPIAVLAAVVLALLALGLVTLVRNGATRAQS
jgi:phage terminase large subunit-like protein